MLNWLSKDFKQKIKFHKNSLLFVLGSFGSLLTYIFSKLMIIKPEGVFIGQANSWSDWVVHISITNIFANKPISEWFLYHPFFANGKLTYGFLIHLITALFMKIGLKIDSAFFIVSIILSFLFLIGLYFFYYQISKSRKQSILGIFIFFTASGMGVFRFLNQINLNEILNPMQDYTRFLQYDWLAGNILEAMIIPQRAFFIGAAIGVWVLNLFLWALNTKPKFVLFKKKKLVTKKHALHIFAGLLAGLLPIAHMHSFIVIVIVTGVVCLFNWKQYKSLAYFVIPAGFLSTLLYFSFVHGGIQIDNFMRISLGWTVLKTQTTPVPIISRIFLWFKMWFKVWGTFLPVVILSLLYFKTEKIQKKVNPVFIGFLSVFALANIIIFQPTAWDNTKLFAWVYLGLSILVSKLLFTLWQKSKQLKVVVIVLLITLSFTGLISIFRVLNFEPNTHLLSTTQEIEFAKQIATNTKTDAIFLTANNHNHPIPLWANRPIYLGYLGWVRNFGFDHRQRERDTYFIYSGQQGANQIIIENKISYIYYGPTEKAILNANTDYLQQFPVAFENESTTVYDTRVLWQ